MCNIPKDLICKQGFSIVQYLLHLCSQFTLIICINLAIQPLSPSFLSMALHYFFNVKDPNPSAINQFLDLQKATKWSYCCKIRFHPEPCEPDQEVIFPCNFNKSAFLSLKFDNARTRYFICRWIVHQSCSIVQNLGLNYYLVVSYPQQCYTRINANHWYSIIIAIHIIFCIFSCRTLTIFYNLVVKIVIWNEKQTNPYK